MDKNLNQLEVNLDHVTWSAPESVLTGLRSSDEDARLAAFRAMGLNDSQVHRDLWLQASPTKGIGRKVVTPDQVRLTYAALGDPAEKQAILSVFIAEAQVAALAVAIPAGAAWNRIAFVSCWCKYDMGPDPLSEFAQIEDGPWDGRTQPPPLELVVHASGGGSGLYDQTEAHYRVRKGELLEVASFVSRYLECNGSTRGAKYPCTLDRRWFYPRMLEQGPGRILVSAHGEFAMDGLLKSFWDLRPLEIQELRRFQCTTYLWDQQRFRYLEATDPKNSCDPDKTQ